MSDISIFYSLLLIIKSVTLALWFMYYRLPYIITQIGLYNKPKLSQLCRDLSRQPESTFSDVEY